MGRKMAKMRKTKVEEMDSLAETDRLVMKQQGKTMDSIPSGHWIGNSIEFLCALHTSSYIST